MGIAMWLALASEIEVICNDQDNLPTNLGGPNFSQAPLLPIDPLTVACPQG